MPAGDRPPADLAALVQAEAPQARGDRLAALQAMGARLRDLLLEKAVADEHAAQLGRSIQAIEQREMPDLMIAAHTDNIGVMPEGNKPGVDFELKRYTHAVIGSDWDAERRARAFLALEQLGAGDLVRHMVVVEFNREEHEAAVALAARLVDGGYSTTVKKDVHWATLTSWVKKKLGEGAELPMDTLGAHTGWVVKCKQRE